MNPYLPAAGPVDIFTNATEKARRLDHASKAREFARVSSVIARGAEDDESPPAADMDDWWPCADGGKDAS